MSKAGDRLYKEFMEEFRPDWTTFYLSDFILAQIRTRRDETQSSDLTSRSRSSSSLRTKMGRWK